MPFVNPNASIGNQEKAVLHVVKKKLDLDDLAYQAVLWGAAQVTSSKDLTFRGYWAAMDRFKELGKAKGVKIFLGNGGDGSRRSGKMRPYQEPVQGKRVGMEEMATPEQQKMIYALWEDVARIKSPHALLSFLNNRFKVLSMRWLTKDKATEVIEVLKKMQERKLKEGN